MNPTSATNNRTLLSANQVKNQSQEAKVRNVTRSTRIHQPRKLARATLLLTYNGLLLPR